MKPTTDDFYALAKLQAAQALNGELARMSNEFRPLGDYLASRPAKSRRKALEAALLLRPDKDAIIRAIADIDPLGPPPAASGPQFATAADLHRVSTGTRWVWDGWIPAACVVGIASPEGTGKTRFALDLARRVWLGMPWPDGQAMTLAQAPTLWVCSDGHHDEIAENLAALGLPDEAIVFPAPPGDPYANCNLDSDETWDWLENAIASVRPAFTFIDTLTFATSLDLCDQKAVARLKGPLVDLVQAHQCNIVLNLHVSKEGQALGRRIKGVTRSLMHLEAPDSDQPERLRLWVEKTYGKRPPPLGVTIAGTGNTYDDKPPRKAELSKGGRPPDKRGKAEQFIRDSLAKENDQIANNLCIEWEGIGGSESTFWRAVRDLAASGDITTDGGKGTGKQTMLHLSSVKTQNP